jgi:hypothetical protein
MNKYDKKHIANVRGYQRRIDSIYKKAVEQISMRSAGLDAPDGYIFTFDDFPALRKQIDALISKMQSDIEFTVTDGVRAEWDLANAKNDALVGTLPDALSQLAKYHRTHEDALSAFLGRKQGGLGLSENVWKYATQFKDEIEMGLDVGIRDGLDAASMARQLKQYLQFPDMLFRRVRDEHGVLHLSQRAAAFHPGQGVYRSSYKNARRLAATETNMAYRTSDYERWKDLDFIVGIEIHLSNNHTCLNNKGKPVPFFDICDELQGKYPKEFKFVGWHPHCRCIATPIMKTKAELDADDERLKRGEEPSDPHDSENAVTDMPDGWKQWMEDNAERLENAKSMPYFIRDNFKDGDPSQGLRWMDKPKELTVWDIAEKRHAARTPEQIQAIQDAWNARKEENRLIMQTANKVYTNAVFLWREVDATKLEAMLSNPVDVNLIKREMRSVAKQISEQRARERALTDLIPNAHNLHSSQFTLKELEEAHAAIKRTFSRWTWDLESDASLQFLKGKLEREIAVVSNTAFKTRDVAKQAFETRLAIVNRRIEINKIKAAFPTAFDFAKTTRSKVIKQLAAEIDAMIADDSIAAGEIRRKAADLNQKAGDLLARQMARKAKPANIPVGSMTEAEVKAEFVKLMNVAGQPIREADIIIRDGCIELSSEQHRALANACKITQKEMMQAKSHGNGGYIGTSNSFKINGAFRDVKGKGAFKIVGDVRNNPNLTLAADMYGGKLNADDLITIDTLDKVIARNKLPFPVKLVRNLDFNGINPFFNGALTDMTPVGASRQIATLADKAMMPDAGFMSASSNARQNVFTHRRFQLQIEVPQGTPIYVTKNFYESECILGRSTALQFKSVEYDPKNRICIIKCVVK